jgi:predicted RecA/RadA family phage recombinase
MARFVQEGDALEQTAPSGGVVALRGVLIAGIFSIAMIDAAAGETFVGRRKGVFIHAAATHASNQAWAVGDALYWDDTAKKLTKTAAGNAMVAVAVEAKASTATEGKAVIIPRLAPAGAAIADLAGGADLPTTVTKVNAIISALEAGGIILA